MKAGTTTVNRMEFVNGWGPSVGYYSSTTPYPAVVDSLEFSSVVGNRKKPNPFHMRRTLLYPFHGTRNELWTYKVNGSVQSRSTVVGQRPSTFSSYDNNFIIIESVMKRNVTQAERDAAYNIAIKRLISAVQDSDLNLAMAAAESGELKTLHTSLLSSIKKATGVLRRVSALPSAAANAWLVWHFALSPVISDAYALARHTKTLFETKAVKSSGSISVNYTYGRGTGKYVTTGNIKHKFGVRFQVRDRAWFEASRLGFTNPAGIAWELVPLSFVFDYFFSIGGYLAALESSYATGLSFLEGYSTATSRLVTITRPAASAYNTVSDATVNMSYSQDIVAEYIESRCDRVVLTSFPSGRLPTFDLDLGSQQLLSLAALLQVFTFKR